MLYHELDEHEATKAKAFDDSDEAIAFCTKCGHDLTVGQMTTCKCSVDHWEISPIGIDENPMMFCTFPGGVIQLSLNESVALCTNMDREWFLYDL